jgi:hypothetical protein
MAATAVRKGVEERAAPVKPVLDVMVLYEDLNTALRAKHSLGLLSVHLSSQVGFCVRWWRLDLLREPLLAEQAAIEAAASGVIILSVHGRDALRAELGGWLTRWLAHKTDRPSALAALLDPDPAHSASSPPIVVSLKQLAVAAHAAFFCSSSPPPLTTLASVPGRPSQRINPRHGRQEPQPVCISPAKAA